MRYAIFRFLPARVAYGALAGVAALSLLTGCQSAPPASDSLYAALGQRSGIAALTAKMLLNVAADKRISGIFRDTDINRLHGMLTDYICQRSGGPCRYSGDDMVDAHRGLGINSADFNALVENLIHAMDAQHLPTGTQNRLLARLAPLHDDIVGNHPLPPPEIMQLIVGHDPIYRYIEPSLD